ncbi:MAG: hypothetical protein AB7G44_15330, partial [Bacteroidia bacterium]
WIAVVVENWVEKELICIYLTFFACPKKSYKRKVRTQTNQRLGLSHKQPGLQINLWFALCVDGLSQETNARLLARGSIYMKWLIMWFVLG